MTENIAMDEESRPTREVIRQRVRVLIGMVSIGVCIGAGAAWVLIATGDLQTGLELLKASLATGALAVITAGVGYLSLTMGREF